MNENQRYEFHRLSGTTWEQWVILRTLDKADRTVRDLCLQRREADSIRYLEALEDLRSEGYVRQIVPDRRRAVFQSLTTEGREYFETIRQRVAA